MYIDKQNLIKLGANEKIISLIENNYLKGLIPARIITQHSSLYEASITPNKSLLVVLTGSLKNRVINTIELPVAGDWILVEDKGTDKLPIHSILPRSSLISRIHKYKGEQPISANIDSVFFTFSLDPKNFSIEKIKHYLSLNIKGKIKIYIILNKIDLSNENIPKLISTISKQFEITQQHIIPLDSIKLVGYDILKSKLIPFETSTFIGPSGVGKSTIINNLYGKKILETSNVNKNYRGRHTTTTRKIIILSNGHIVIDTPGISFIETQQKYNEKFSQIFEYSINCRFSDCKHISEPGCYVKEMIVNGNIKKELYDEYLKFLKKYGKI